MLSATICEWGILLLWELFGSIGMRLVWQLLEVWSLLRPNIFPIRGGGGWGARPFLAIPLQSTFHHHRSQGMHLHKLPLTKYVPPGGGAASQHRVINQKFRPLYGVLPWFWNENWSVILLGGFCRSNWIYSSPSQCFPNKTEFLFSKWPTAGHWKIFGQICNRNGAIVIFCSVSFVKKRLRRC